MDFYFVPQDSKRFRGERLRDAREKRGLSQEELAARIGAAQTQITRYEKNNSQPSQAVLIRLAETLEVSTDYLLGLVEGIHDHISTQELSPTEMRVVDAYRRGDLKGLIDILARGDE